MTARRLASFALSFLLGLTTLFAAWPIGVKLAEAQQSEPAAAISAVAPPLDAAPPTFAGLAADAAPAAIVTTTTTTTTATPSIALVDRAADNPLGVTGEFLKAVKTSDWRMAAALGLALLMAGLGKARDKFKWFRGDRGGTALALTLGFSGAIITALAAHATVDLKLFTTAAQVSILSIGGYTALMKLWKPSDKKADPA